MIDTCQAESMHQKFYSPNILAVASSKIGEDSLSVRFTLPCEMSSRFQFFPQSDVVSNYPILRLIYIDKQCLRFTKKRQQTGEDPCSIPYSCKH